MVLHRSLNSKTFTKSKHQTASFVFIQETTQNIVFIYLWFERILWFLIFSIHKFLIKKYKKYKKVLQSLIYFYSKKSQRKNGTFSDSNWYNGVFIDLFFHLKDIRFYFLLNLITVNQDHLHSNDFLRGHEEHTVMTTHKNYVQTYVLYCALCCALQSSDYVGEVYAL